MRSDDEEDGGDLAPPPPRRPGLSAAVGMGVSFESSGLLRGRTVPVPAFQVQVGAGEGFLGIEGRLFATQASGRYQQVPSTTGQGGPTARDTPVDRLALELLLAVRPLTYTFRNPERWLQRMLASLTLNVGFAGENAAIGQPSVIRLGPVVGAHLDLPLLARGVPLPLRIRLASRRMFGGTATAGTVQVSDTRFELLAGLALVF